tara:strand:- start:6394 stop:7341 length:948 start_codon:yes stop_codon:yes gene_type:complete
MSFAFGFSPNVEMTFKIIYALLISFTLLFVIWKKVSPKTFQEELLERTKSWWIIISLIFVALGFGKTSTIWMLAFLSFVALRELLSNVPLSINDRKAVFWCYLGIPIQFYAISIGYYHFFIIWVPVILFIILALRRIAIDETENFTQSLGVLLFANLLIVYSLGHMAYLMVLDIPYDKNVGNDGLLLYLLFLTQFNDVLQFIWGKLLGKRKISPKVSPNKTWEGFLGGLICTTILGYVFRFLTPLNEIQSLTAGFLIAFMGFFGDLNMSTIKRDMGVKDMGNIIPGHGGIMDRIDSLSFSSLVFFHLVHMWTRGM